MKIKDLSFTEELRGAPMGAVRGGFCGTPAPGPVIPLPGIPAMPEMPAIPPFPGLPAIPGLPVPPALPGLPGQPVPL